ncbi:MAG TPA: YtxH domain-containing protein [Candidatus Saccharimonadales bacterium]|nr:YtxH domain-containing protein [Candidatus Saccharimonadales bacterium]
MGKFAKKLALGTGIAAVAGYVAGILTAPKSGKETRKDIKDAANKSLAEAEKELKKLHTELNGLINDGKKKSKDLKGKAEKELNAAVDKAKTSKEKARTVLSALHEGDAEDKDLQKAIAEANRAIKHMKTYLKK